MPAGIYIRQDKADTMTDPRAEIASNIWFNIHRLRWGNRISKQQLEETLGIHQKKMLDMEANHELPSLSQLSSTARFFNLTLDELLHHRLSVNSPALHSSSLAKSELPPKYGVTAFSKVRTSYHIIDFLENSRRRSSIDQFLRYADVPYSVFSDLNNQINIQFITDLCKWLIENRIATPNDLYLMGLNTFEVNRYSELGQKLSRFRSIKELYLFQIEEFMKFFDRNCHYRVRKATENECIICWKQNQEVADGLGKKVFSSVQVETYQMGVAASFPMFLGLPKAKVKLISSLQVNDRETAMHVDYSEANFLLKTRGPVRITG